jgi:RNA polymerase-binding transcription factor DksA
MSDLGDVYDRASDREMADREAAIIAAQVKFQEKHPDFDGLHCLVCEEEINLGRLNLGRIRCFECQTSIEKRNKFYAT